MQDIMKAVRERRGKIVSVTAERLIDYFQPSRPGYIQMPELVNVPEDAFVHRVYFSKEIDAFCFLLIHESFSKVESGMPYPYARVEVKLYEVMLKQDRPERLDNPDSTGAYLTIDDL